MQEPDQQGLPSFGDFMDNVVKIHYENKQLETPQSKKVKIGYESFMDNDDAIE